VRGGTHSVLGIVRHSDIQFHEKLGAKYPAVASFRMLEGDGGGRPLSTDLWNGSQRTIWPGSDVILMNEKSSANGHPTARRAVLKGSMPLFFFRLAMAAAAFNIQSSATTNALKHDLDHRIV
jgi:hypothetical protein